MRNTIKVNNHRLISRSDLAAIADMIPHGAKILDLGCGSGRLLKALKMLKDAKIMGVELDQGKIIECVRRGVPVCDCYAQWKTMHEAGVDTTELLANQLNHPTREMNWLFAVSLLHSIFNEP